MRIIVCVNKAGIHDCPEPGPGGPTPGATEGVRAGLAGHGRGALCVCVCARGVQNAYFYCNCSTSPDVSIAQSSAPESDEAGCS